MWPDRSMIEYRNHWPNWVSPIPAGIFLPGKYAHLRLTFRLLPSRCIEDNMRQRALAKYLYHLLRQHIWFEGETGVLRWQLFWS
jgi:hypothetical protein